MVSMNDHKRLTRPNSITSLCVLGLRNIKIVESAASISISNNNNLRKLDNLSIEERIGYENSFGYNHPELVKEYSSDNTIDIFKVPEKSDIIAKWICPNCTKEYKTSFKSRAYGFSSCEKCKKYNEYNKMLCDARPDLKKYYVGERPFNTYSYKSNVVVEWMCDYKHKFKMKISRMVEYETFYCPKCPKINNINLAITHPELEKEWSINNPKELSEYKKSDLDIVEWTCSSCGGNYMCSIYTKVKHPKSCPYCKNTKVLPGFNDLKSKHPELANEWSINNSKPMDQIISTSSFQYKWICSKCNGEYTATIRQRLSDDFVCPYCDNKRLKSGFNDIGTLHPELKQVWADKRDISQVKISYKGHVYWKCLKCNGKFTRSVHKYLVDSHCPYCSNDKLLSGYNDISITDPELAKEYSPNNARDIKTIRKDSVMRVFWICPTCKGEYRYIVRDRQLNDDSCPYCNRAKALVGRNDISTTDPELAKEYSPNNERDIKTIRKELAIRALWICPTCKGEYEYVIKDRQLNDKSCPYCYGKRALDGYNDISTTDPILAKEYSPNNERDISTIRKDLAIKALWVCPTCKGEYEYVIKDRQLNDKSCPYCYGKRALDGYNDISTTDPELAKEYSQNNERDISTIRKDLAIKALWVCPTCKGEYKYIVRNRQLNDESCPYCNGRKVLTGFNDLATTHKHLKDEWCEVENVLIGNKKFNQYKYTNTARCWWKCPTCNNKYMMNIDDKIIKDKRHHIACPLCEGRQKNRRLII